MDSVRVLSWAVVAALAGTLLLASPALGGLDLTDERPALGGGNATVVDVSIERPPSVSEGRFGTDRTYLRSQTATARVRNVRGTPRLTLRSEAPALGHDEMVARVLEPGTRGVVRLSLPDRGFDQRTVPDGPVRVRTTVRLQSFDDDRVLLERNVTVGDRE